ncbi:phage baseplate assembly protein V [candidate division KSB1 bacterium]|nr:phage baseplate assembly protein V [candidate division KSB1 bacterium]
MSLLELLSDEVDEFQKARRIDGVVIAKVTNNEDPEKMHRVKVEFPWLSEDSESHWARIATLMAGNDRGAYFLPEVGDEVLVAFEHGDIHFPFVVGALWNGVDKPPETNSDGKNNRRLFKSRSGHKIILDDKDGSEKIEIIDKSEKNIITIDTKSNTITLTSDKDIVLQAPKGKISLEAKEINLKSQAATKIEAGAGMDVKATANLVLKGAMVQIN